MKTLIIILLATMFLHAQQLNDRVTTFITEFYASEGALHRSGLVTASDDLFDGVTVTATLQDVDAVTRLDAEVKERTVTSWEAGVLPLYAMEYTLTQSALESVIAEQAPLFDYLITFSERQNLFTFTGVSPGGDTVSAFDTEASLRKANALLKTKLPFLKGKVEFQSELIEKEETLPIIGIDTAQKVETVLGYGVRYRRVFRGGILKRNLSFVEVWFHPNGALNKIEMRWPTFNSSTPKQIITLNESWLSLQFRLADYLGNDMEKLSNVMVKGVSLAWTPSKNEVDGSFNGSIEPCYSFRLSVPRIDNDMLEELVYDIPAIVE